MNYYIINNELVNNLKAMEWMKDNDGYLYNTK